MNALTLYEYIKAAQEFFKCALDEMEVIITSSRLTFKYKNQEVSYKLQEDY